MMVLQINERSEEEEPVLWWNGDGERSLFNVNGA
jgi:hypothetical protein